MNLDGLKGNVIALGIIFAAFVSFETRYAKAADMDKLLRNQEQKVIWDLEENIDTSEAEDQHKWFIRLRDKVAEFCAEYPDENECAPEYLEEIEAEMEE